MKTTTQQNTTNGPRAVARKNAILLYRTHTAATAAMRTFFDSLREAEMENDFEISLYNLETLQAQDLLSSVTPQLAAASVLLFALDEMPSDPLLEWVDSWSEQLAATNALLVLIHSNRSINEDDHALMCSYFRAVAARSLRHFVCEGCGTRLPAAPVETLERSITPLFHSRATVNSHLHNLAVA